MPKNITYSQGKKMGPKLKSGQRAYRSKGQSEWTVHDHRAPMSGAGPRRDKKLREAEEKAVGKKK